MKVLGRCTLIVLQFKGCKSGGLGAWITCRLQEGWLGAIDSPEREKRLGQMQRAPTANTPGGVLPFWFLKEEPNKVAA